MIYRISMIIVTCMLLPFSAGAFAIPKADVVVDQAGVIRSDAIRQNLVEYQKNTGHEIGVLVVKTLEGNPIEQVAIDVARTWGIGDEKRDDGILVLVATEDREARIEVGYGLEGAVPDITAKQIIDQVMVPFFKTGDYEGGISAGIEALQKSIAGEPVFPKSEQANLGRVNPIYLGMIIWFVMNFFWTLFGKSKAWWHGGVVGGIGGLIVGIAIGGALIVVSTVLAGTIGGLVLDYFASRFYKGPGSGSGGTGFFGGFGGGSSWGSGSGGSSSSFGGFSGGSFGGGGASGRW